MNLFTRKRSALQKLLKENQALVLLSNPLTTISGDTIYSHVQHPNFYYFTGIIETDCALYIDSEKTVLYIKAKDPLKELWDGKMLGLEGAKKLGFSEVLPYSEFTNDIKIKLKNKRRLFCQLNKNQDWDKILFSIIKKENSRNHEIEISISDANELIYQLRKLKNDPEEIEGYKDIGKITGEAYKEYLKNSKNLNTEAKVEGFFYNYLRSNGVNRFSYDPICAADENSCFLHYHENHKTIENFILLDIGFRKNYFNSDITRTYPRKRFNPLQEKVYQIVLDCNQFVTNFVKPGNCTLLDLKNKASEFMEARLKKEIPGLKHGIADYFPHGLGHSLGLDVHDCLTRDETLKEGHLITNEPGLYFRFEDDPAELKGFGVRIEDDLLVTSSGVDVLTSAAPKELKEVYSILGI